MTRKFWIALTILTLTAGIASYIHLRKKIGTRAFDIDWSQM